MAKTKQDYIDQGRADALANNPRKFTGNESWQAQCYSSGWIVGLTEAASQTEAQCIDAPYENIGDSRVNADGSVSTLVDNGDGTIGTYTTGCPRPDHPVMHDPYGDVPIPARRVLHRERFREFVATHGMGDPTERGYALGQQLLDEGSDYAEAAAEVVTRGLTTAPETKHGHYRDDPLYATAHAVGAHIEFLLREAGNDGGKRAHRLRKKATALIAKWKPVMTADLTR